VTAFDKTTRSRANISITASTGHRSTEEIERMVEEAERLAKDDAARLARIEARNELESAVYHANEAMATLPDTSGREALAETLKATEAWIADEANAGTPASAFRSRIATLEAALGRA
jgi:molecular chaperone DnaK (HSP70)